MYNGTTSAFTYGSDGLRRSMKVGSGHTTHYALDGQSVAREFSDVNDDDELFNQDGTIQAGELVATYLVGPRGVEYREDSSGARKWYLYDGLGSVLGEVDETGQVTATNRTDVFGKQRASSGTSTTSHKYCGKLGHSTDDGTGLIYMRARYMDPELGRFISEDIARHGQNWFVYANANPVTNVDPDGKFTLIDILTGSTVSIYENAAWGALVGVATRFVGDIYAGGFSTPGQYASSLIFGAALGALGGNIVGLGMVRQQMMNIAGETVASGGMMAMSWYASVHLAMIEAVVMEALTPGFIDCVIEGMKAIND